MKASRCQSLIETLEDRKLLSAITGGLTLTPIASPIPIEPISAPVLGLSGRTINAEANESFRAVIGSIDALTPLAISYTLEGTIDWGDGTPSTPATFIHQPMGVTDILGGHTYAAVGSDAITITLFQAPPSSSAAPIILLGTISSTANVISSPGGVTLNEPAGVPFAANVGSFTSTLSELVMTATIDWGDGTVSIGKILATPGAAGSPVAGGRFVVVGQHSYAQTGSYAVNVTVTASPVLDPPNPTPDFVLLVAQIESVIDVLPTPAVVVPISPVAPPTTIVGGSTANELLLDRM